ncbi:MAG: PAS domain S-box protein [Legionella sp.]|jgi:PAS domain S-box-containing protein
MSENTPDQRQLLYQLMTSEERYQNFMNATSDAIFVHNLNGLILDVNNAACQSLGYTRQELINTYAWEVEIAINEETIKQNILKLPNGPFSLEGRHRKKDGATFPVDVRLSVFNSMDQQFILAIVRDISEPKRAQATIRKLTRALDQSPLVTIITDKTHTIEYVNEVTIVNIGYDYNEIVGQNFLVLKTENTSLNVYNSIWEQLNKGDKWHGKLSIKSKTGEYLQPTVIISPLRDENNIEITHYLIIMDFSIL